MTDLARDHADLSDTFAARRYLQKFQRITGHLARVAAELETEGSLTRNEVKILASYIQRLDSTFHALGNKYLLTGRDTGTFFGSLTFDRSASGFPVFQEILTMANDAQQAQRHLTSMPTETALKDQMIRKIVGDLDIPTRLQFALSQRLYYEELAKGTQFWARNDPELIWLKDIDADRRSYLLHWAVYDSQVNLPAIYMMEIDDSGRTPLPRDAERWTAVQAHLMAQSLGGLKLLTIAKGFDIDFDDLHPKRLRRFHVGPMYSYTFTRQMGALRDVLKDARAPEGQDWALAFTSEELISERVEWEKSGWFGKVQREIYALDPFSGRAADTGATRTERAIILPERPYQVLAERQPAGFAEVRKFVVSDSGRVLSYR